MSLASFLKQLFGGEEEPPPPPPVKHAAPTIKQVYEAKPLDEQPEWMTDVGESELPRILKEHLKCDYELHVERQRIYLPGAKDINGEMEIIFEGVAGSCSAQKDYGTEVAERHGYSQNYRYVDTNHILRHCCDNYEHCPFRVLAIGEKRRAAARMGITLSS